MKKFFQDSKGETIIEALTTFLIATVSILIIATSILTARKIINQGKERLKTLDDENEIVESFIMGDDEEEFDEVTIYKDKISISSDGFLYSENEIECIETSRTGMRAFR